MANYITPGYVEAGYSQTGISIDWGTKVITVPQFFLTMVSGVNYALDTNAFRIALKELEDSEAGMTFPITHNHNTVVLLGGIEYARSIEIINGYTVTFESLPTPYKVFLRGSNNNILDVTNLNNVSVAPSNSAGLIQSTEIQQGSFEGQVTMNTVGTAGTLYPIGTGRVPVSNIVDAKIIAASRGIKNFFLESNYTFGATDNVAGLYFHGKGATLNVSSTAHTKVTLTQGCVTTNSTWEDCVITGYQGGESHYVDCMIDGLENAHCIYERCGMLDGTARGYTIKQASGLTSGHASYYKECFSDEGTFILDRNGTGMNVTMDGFGGRVKIINQNKVSGSGQVWIHLNGGTITIDASCTKGTITCTGTGILINNSQGTQVDASAFLTEGFDQVKLTLESLRQTHQGFGVRWFVDPINGNDLAPGNSSASPVRTLTMAHDKAVSGRGDVIYMLAPGAGAATINERVIISKEDIHLRGPGRGLQIQPSVPNLGPVLQITGNNCSMSGFVVRTSAGSTQDHGIVISGKFSRLEKLYLVGSGQYGFGNTSRGVVYTGGDYHEQHDMEVEKFGDSGVELDDQSDFHSNGSPREISIFGGNYYLNGEHGICIHGKPGAALGTTSRLIRILKGANIHDNGSYGVHSDANTLGVVIDDSVLVHANNNGGVQVLLDGTGYYKSEAEALGVADAVWSTSVTGMTDKTTIGGYIKKTLLSIPAFLGLK